jgi:hypothetical protein
MRPILAIVILVILLASALTAIGLLLYQLGLFS